MEIKCLNNGSSYPSCTKQDAKEMKKVSSLVTSSGDSILINQSCSEGTERVISPCNMPANEGNADRIVPPQAPEEVDSSQNTFLKSDDSSETGDLLKQNNNLSNGRMVNFWQRNGRDRLKQMAREICPSKKFKTESSSSNSTNVIFPASSNESCQDIPADARQSKCDPTGADASTCNKRRVEEPEEKGSSWGLASQISSAGVSNIIFLPWKQENVKNAEIVENVAVSRDSQLAVTADQKSVISEADDTLKLKPNLPKLENAVHGNYGKAESCSQLDDAPEVALRKVEPVITSENSSAHLTYADSAVPNKENSVAESRCETQIFPEHDNRDSCCSAPDNSATNKDRTFSTADFDLNEDVTNEAECPEQWVKEIESCSVHGVFKPKPLTAKSGKLVSLPMTQLELHDFGGWRGPAATSAFRTTSVSQSFHSIKAASTANNNNKSKDFCGRVIDLNIADAGDGCGMENSSMELSSMRAERFKIDLNHENENEDNSHQMFQPPVRMKPVRDFDLNDNPTFQDTVADAHQPGQGTPLLRNREKDNPALPFLGMERHQEYRADPIPMQVYGHVHARPFLVALSPNMLPNIEQMQRVVPVQDKSTYRPTLAPQSVSFPYPNGYCIDPNNRFSPAVYSPGIFPYATDQNGLTIFSPSTHPTFPGASQLTQIPGGTISNGLAYIGPDFDPRSRINMENEIRSGNGGQRFLPFTSQEMEEQIRSFQPAPLTGTAVKRREPEGGWDSHQHGHGYRKMNTWL